MPDLIAKLEKLEGPNPHVDELIWEAIGGWPERKWRSVDYMRVYGTPLTASLDAAVALVERVLPGQWADILRQALSDMGSEYHWHISTKRQSPSLLCKFVLLALLRAKEAQE